MAIPQVEFDRAVSKLMTVGIERVPAENIAVVFHKIAKDKGIAYQRFIDASVQNGYLDIDQELLDRYNLTLSKNIRYKKLVSSKTADVIKREFKFIKR
jgi:hypothetical protein